MHDYNKVINKIKELEPFDPIKKNGDYKKMYPYITAVKSGNPKTKTDKGLVNDWFSLANNMQYKNYEKSMTYVRENKIGKSELGLIGKFNPLLRSFEIGKECVNLLDVRNEEIILNRNGNDYRFDFNIIGAGPVLDITGKVCRKNGDGWKQISEIGTLSASPNMGKKETEIFSQNYILAIGFQSLGGIINQSDLVKIATKDSKTKKVVTFAQYLNGLTKFSDRILESNLRDKDLKTLSKIMNLSQNKKDFFSYIDNLEKVNEKLRKKPEDLNLDDTREMVDESIEILKYLGKMK